MMAIVNGIRSIIRSLALAFFGTAIYNYGQPVDTKANDEKPKFIVDIQASSPSLEFQGLLWEALECLEFVDGHTPPVLYEVRRYQPRSPTHSLPAPQFWRIKTSNVVKPTFNILFVVSRPNKDEDIDPHLACTSIFKVLSALPLARSAKVNIEVARPGTWHAFSQHLSSRTGEWHSKGGVGPWFDIVHFDVHGVVENGRPFLRFLSKSGTRELRQNSETIGKLLQDNEVGIVLMNSCESATISEHEGSNLAAALLDYGISTVVAMQFPLTSSAATVFNDAFYAHFFTVGEGVLPATVFARETMLRNRSRSASLGVKVDLPDFIIPVVYHNPNASNKGATTLHHVPQPTLEAAEKVDSLRSLDTQLQSLGHFFGRSYDVMRLEWVLLSSKASNIVLITGLRGSGRTMLIIWLLRWWIATGLCEKSWHWSYEPGRSQFSVVSWLRDLYNESSPGFPVNRDSIINNLRDQRVLFVVDSLEYAVHRAGPLADTITEDDRRYFKDFITRLQGGKTLVILTPTSTESWLGLPSKCHYRLSGLSYHHSYQLVGELLRGTSHESMLQDPQNSRYIRHLIYRLHFNPASITNTIRGMIQLGSLSDETLSPRTLFEKVLLSWLPPDLNLTTANACLNLVKSVHSKVASDMVQVLMLLGLAAPTNTWSSSFYDFLASKVNSFCGENTSLTRSDISEFVRDNFIGSGWIIQLSGEELPGDDKHYLVHPILTNALRMLLDSGQYLADGLLSRNVLDMDAHASWQQHLFSSFYKHLAVRSIPLWRDQDTKYSSVEPEINSLNYLSALMSLSKNIPQYTATPDLSQIGMSIGICLSLQLCKQLPRSNAVGIPFDVLLEDAEVSLTLFEDFGRQIPNQLLYDGLAFMYCQLCRYLTQFHFFKDSEKALFFIRKRLQVSSQTLPESGSTNDFDRESEACYSALQDFAHVWIIKGNHILRAKAALLASLIICQSFLRQVDSDEFDVQFIHICFLLGVASEIKHEGPTMSEKFRVLEHRIAEKKSVDPSVHGRVPVQSTQVEVLPTLAVAWYAEDETLDMGKISKAVLKSELLIEAGQAEDAKDDLGAFLRQATLIGDKAAEFACHRGLAMVYMSLKGWEVAAQHATRAMELYGSDRDHSKAIWAIENASERMLKSFKLAIIFMRVNDWLGAMRIFLTQGEH
jgi:hypothetical protein